MATEFTKLSNSPSILTPLRGRSDGVATRTVGNVIHISRMPRNTELIIGEILKSENSGDIDRIFLLLTEEEKIALQEYIEIYPDRGFGNEIQDILAKLTLCSTGRIFLRTIGGEELYRNSVILRIIMWLGLNGDVLANYLQSVEETELHELVRLSKAFPETDFKRVYDVYFSKLPLDSIFRLWSQICNGTYASNNSSSSI